jgi:hypothetical protein
MFDFLLPYREKITENPVFAFEIKRFRAPRTVGELKNYFYLIMLIILGAVVGWWILERFSDRINLSYSANLSWESNFLMILFYLSQGVAVLVSLYTGVTTTSFVHRQVESGQWEELLTTPQPTKSTIDAYDALAQIRPWRLTVVELMLKLAFVVIMYLDLLFPIVSTPGVTSPFSTVFCFWCGALVVILTAYGLESLFRMRTLVALGILLALRIRNFVSVTLAMFAFTFVLHGLQIAALHGLWAITFVPRGNTETVFNALVLLPVACLIIVAVFFYLYWGIRTSALGYAMHFQHGNQV